MGAAPPTFSGSASRAKISTSGQVTLPLTIGCPPPGADCRVSVAASGRVRASEVAKRKRVTLGRSVYVVKASSSANVRFKLTTRGRGLLRRLRGIEAKVAITVSRDGSVTTKTVTVRLKAPRRTP